jgi:hypothetical protein
MKEIVRIVDYRLHTLNQLGRSPREITRYNYPRYAAVLNKLQRRLSGLIMSDDNNLETLVIDCIAVHYDVVFERWDWWGGSGGSLWLPEVYLNLNEPRFINRLFNWQYPWLNAWLFLLLYLITCLCGWIIESIK